MQAGKPLGPNVKRLICERAAQLQVERVRERFGNVSLGSCCQAIVDDEAAGLVKAMRDATIWVMSALQAVRLAPDAIPYRDDEQIAGEVLRRIGEKREAEKQSKIQTDGT